MGEDEKRVEVSSVLAHVQNNAAHVAFFALCSLAVPSTSLVMA
jgi:hypothetical protein